MTLLSWLNRDGKLLLASNITRMFGFGFLSIILAIYLSNKNSVGDLLLFSICADKEIKTISIEKLINYVSECEIPKFPISGDYLKKYGYEAGEVLGKKLKSLEEKWIENNFIIEQKVIDKSLGKDIKN